MEYDPAKFQPGDLVRVADWETLGEFVRAWKLHHPLQAFQVVFAGHSAKVVRALEYHEGDMLYELDGVPGLWHEQLLSLP